MVSNTPRLAAGLAAGALAALFLTACGGGSDDDDGPDGGGTAECNASDAPDLSDRYYPWKVGTVWTQLLTDPATGDSEVNDTVVEAYEELCLRCVDVNVPTAVRSSATGEDAADASARGTANDLVLVFFGRIPLDSLKLDGDRRIFDQLIAWDPSA